MMKARLAISVARNFDARRAPAGLTLASLWPMLERLEILTGAMLLTGPNRTTQIRSGDYSSSLACGSKISLATTSVRSAWMQHPSGRSKARLRFRRTTRLDGGRSSSISIRPQRSPTGTGGTVGTRFTRTADSSRSCGPRNPERVEQRRNPGASDATVAPDSQFTGVLGRVQALRSAPALRAPAAAWTRPPRARRFAFIGSTGNTELGTRGCGSYEQEVACSFHSAATTVASAARSGCCAKADALPPSYRRGSRQDLRRRYRHDSGLDLREAIHVTARISEPSILGEPARPSA